MFLFDHFCTITIVLALQNNVGIDLPQSASSYWGNAELPNIHPDQGLRRNSSLADGSQWIQGDLKDLFTGNVRKPMNVDTMYGSVGVEKRKRIL